MGKFVVLISCLTDFILLVMFSCEKNFKNVYEMLEYIIEGEVKVWNKRINF